MSRRRKLEERLVSLEQIRDIMSSLKTLAFLETQKLGRRAEFQQRVMGSIQAASSDFAGHFPVNDWQPECSFRVFIVLGSERGFCGAYNEALNTALQTALTNSSERYAVIAVGEKLVTQLSSVEHTVAIEGATIAEEVQPVLVKIAAAVTDLHKKEGGISLSVIYHDIDTQDVVTRRLFPVIAEKTDYQARAFAPRLGIKPEQMFLSLLEEYMFAALLAACYDALNAENRRRMEHLQGAVDHLNKQCAEISLRRNFLRQEEITEEIEVILLSETPDDTGSMATQ